MIKTKNQVFNNLLLDTSNVLLEIFKKEVSSTGKKIWISNLKEMIFNKNCNFRPHEIVRFGVKTSEVLYTFNIILNSFINLKGLEANKMKRFILNLGYNKNSKLFKYHFALNTLSSTDEKYSFVKDNLSKNLTPKSLEKYFSLKIKEQDEPTQDHSLENAINTWFSGTLEEGIDQLKPYITEYNFKIAKSTLEVLKTVLIKGIEV